jgi:FHA domain
VTALPSLLVTDGPQSGRRIEVTAELVIGRHDVAFTIDDPQISRRHAVLRPGDDRLEIEDLGSRNGTWVNDRRIDSPTSLAPGDVIRIGTCSLEVVGVDATVAAPAPELPQASVAATPPLVPPLSAPAAAPPPVPVSAAGIPPFGAFSPPAARRRRVAATRQLVPMLLAFGTVVATSVALIVYFAAR